MEETHVFVVVVEHLAKLPARYVRVVEDLVIRAFSVKILMYTVVGVSKLGEGRGRGALALRNV